MTTVHLPPATGVVITARMKATAAPGAVRETPAPADRLVGEPTAVQVMPAPEATPDWSWAAPAVTPDSATATALGMTVTPLPRRAATSTVDPIPPLALVRSST